MKQLTPKKAVKKQMTISEEAKNRLFKMKRLGESYSELILRLCDAYKEEKAD